MRGLRDRRGYHPLGSQSSISMAGAGRYFPPPPLRLSQPPRGRPTWHQRTVADAPASRKYPWLSLSTGPPGRYSTYDRRKAASPEEWDQAAHQEGESRAEGMPCSTQYSHLVQFWIPAHFMGWSGGHVQTSVERNAPSTDDPSNSQGSSSSRTSFKDAVHTSQDAGRDGTECWTLERAQTQYRWEGRSAIQYDHLPTMREGHSPAGWDAWGCPWAFMNVARRELPEGEDTWYYTLAGGGVLITVLVRFDREPYFFPSARALLQALQRNACDQGVKITPPTREGWTLNDQFRVEALLRPETNPPCEAVMAVLKRWNGFPYSGQGYRAAVPMPTRNTTLTLLDNSWDSPTEDFGSEGFC